MTRFHFAFVFCVVSLLTISQDGIADEPITPENFVAPSENVPEEPFAQEFSLEKAAGFLDAASLNWQKQRQCMTCHTNYAFLYARPAISSGVPAHAEVRSFAEKLVRERWQEKGPRWDAEVVATAAALAFNDAATTGKLHETTRVALDRMWTVQSEDGGWKWLKCGWPPMESDDHYGVSLAAIAVGVAPDGYAQTEQAQKGLQGIRKYLKENPPPTLHHRTMLLWASSYVDKLISDEEKQKCVTDLTALQKEDGGWALPTLYEWKRSDGKEQDLNTSDGYATGFVIYTLLRNGVPADSATIERGVEWLKTHQRESGRWFTRSLNKDSKHYISHIGTAMAVMAIAAASQPK